MAYMIWVTAACNLRCKYCYEGIKKVQKNMTKQTALETIDFIKRDFNYYNEIELLVNFHGGEPFINFAIMKFIISELKNYYMDKCKVVFTVTTNATLLTPEIMTYIVAEKIEPSISIDGDQFTHDLMRVYPNGTGSHEKVMENARKLLKQISCMRVSMVYSSETVMYFSENVKYLLEEGFRFLAAGLDSFDKGWDEKHIPILKQEIIEIKEILKNYPQSHVSVCEKLQQSGKICRGGEANKHIYYDGNIYPCVVTGGKSEFLIGNVKTGVNISKKNQLLSYSCMDNKECRECALNNYCKAARCTLINKVKTGDYIKPAPIDCYYTRLIYQICGLEIAQNKIQ